MPIKLGLDDAALATIAVDLHQLPGVVVDAKLTRDYPFGEALSHVLGYVGRVSAEDLFEARCRALSGLPYRKGRAGKTLRAAAPRQARLSVCRDQCARTVLRVLEKQAPVPGKNLRLYLDLNLQREAVAALGDRQGAVVTLGPLTGGVLAMVSN